MLAAFGSLAFLTPLPPRDCLLPASNRLSVLALTRRSSVTVHPSKRPRHPPAFMSQRLPPPKTASAPSPKVPSDLLPHYNEKLSRLRRAHVHPSTTTPILAAMARTSTPPDSQTFIHLLFICLRPRPSPSLAETHLHNAESFFSPSPPAPAIYAAYLAVCARATDSARADSAWRKILSFRGRPPPNTRAIGAYVDCLARCDRADDARDVLRAFPDGDTLVSRTSIVSGLARIRGREDAAIAALEEMIDDGFLPNCRAYTALTHALGKARRAPEAEKFLERAVADGIETDGLLYESVISAHGAVGDVDGAFRVRGAMRERGFEITDRTFEGLVFACGNAGRTQRATIVYEAAKAASMDTPRVLNAYASALLRRGVKDERAEELLGKMDTAVRGGRLGQQGVNPFLFSKKRDNIRRILLGSAGNTETSF